MWWQPVFDTKDAAAVMLELRECRKIHGGGYIKINAYDSTRSRETVALSFIVDRPKVEPGFGVARDAGPGRQIHYRVHSYATDRPAGQRYQE